MWVVLVVLALLALEFCVFLVQYPHRPDSWHADRRRYPL
jgi:hypothetical protein